MRKKNEIQREKSEIKRQRQIQKYREIKRVRTKATRIGIQKSEEKDLGTMIEIHKRCKETQ